ncbi:MAG: hypothetical protein RIK87_06255 [Fuerstiella sp.]
MRELPTIELTEKQAEQAERSRDVLAARSAAVVDFMSRQQTVSASEVIMRNLAVCRV